MRRIALLLVLAGLLASLYIYLEKPYFTGEIIGVTNISRSGYLPADLIDANISISLWNTSLPGDVIPADINITVYLVEGDSVLNISSMNITDFILNSTYPTCGNLSEDADLNDIDNAWDWESVTAAGYTYNETCESEIISGALNFTVNLSAFFPDGLYAPLGYDSYNITMNATCGPLCGAYENEQVAYSTELFSVPDLIITISGPANNSVVTAGQVIQFQVDKITDEGWVNSTNITIASADDSINVTFAMDNTTTDPVFTNFTYSYTLPDINSTYLNVTAHAFNDSKEVNTSITLRATRASSNIPEIAYFCGVPTYAGENSTVNVTVKADLDILLESINLTVYDPDGETFKLIDIDSNWNDYKETSHFYVYNYSFEPNKTGDYIIEAEVSNINEQRATRNITLYVRSNQTMNLTGVNIDSIRLRDICSEEILYSGSTITEELPAGQYDTEAVAGKVTLYLVNSTIDNTVTMVCNYTDIGENATMPVRSEYSVRAVDRWESDCFIKFDSVNVTYDYSTISASFVYEDRLELYKCDTQDNCSWGMVTDYKDSANDKIRAVISNFSVLMLTEDTPATIVPASAAGGGGGGGSKAEILVAIDLISPEPISLYAGGKIVVPITAKNTGTVPLSGITLTVRTSSPEIKAKLSKGHIDLLTVGEEFKLEMAVEIGEAIPEELQSITIDADVQDPRFRDSARFFVNLLDIGARRRDVVIEKLEFLKAFLEKTPQCANLTFSIAEIEKVVKEKDYDRAIEMADAILQQCKERLNPEIKRLEKPKKPRYTLYILLIELVSFIIVLSMIYRYFRRKRLRMAM